jgi:hypothetical protein
MELDKENVETNSISGSIKRLNVSKDCKDKKENEN